MDGPRTADPLVPQQGMAADNGSAGPLPRQSDSAEGARSKNGMHPQRKYELLASEAPEGGRANTGDTGSEAFHGATADQDGTDPEEKGNKTLQRALRARDNNGVGDKASEPPNG